MDTLTEIIRGLIGTYNPVTYSTLVPTSQTSSEFGIVTNYTSVDIVPSGFSGVDFEYIIASLLLLLLLRFIYKAFLYPIKYMLSNSNRIRFK